MAKKNDFKWNVWVWNINHDKIEPYDVVPMFTMELDRLRKKDRPKTKEEFDKFLKNEARYHFWAKCEYEMIVCGWPKSKNEEKVDVYQQLELNWDKFADLFWESVK